MLIVEGFPAEPDWYESISELGWDKFDGVFAISTDEFASAFHGMSAEVPQNVIVLKCPDSSFHICYHPGVVLLRRRGASLPSEFQGLEKMQGRTIEITDTDGTILARCERELPQPFTHLDLIERLRGVRKKEKEFLSMFNTTSDDSPQDH